MIDVPIGGTIRDQVLWNCVVTGVPTKKFALIVVYGTNTNGTFLGFQQVSSSPYTLVTTGSVISPTHITTNLDTVIQEVYYPIGIYDAMTLIVDGDNFENVLAFKIEDDVLNVMSSFGALIFSTAFSKQ